MRFKKSRIAVSVFFGVLSLVMIGLWVRSYWWLDIAHWYKPRVSIQSTIFRGRIGISWDTFPDSLIMPDVLRQDWFGSDRINGSTSVTYNDGTGHPLPSYLGFQSSWLSAAVRTMETSLVIPFWFVTVLAATAAFAPWSRTFRWRFSLRTLLIFTTLISLASGLIIYLTQK